MRKLILISAIVLVSSAAHAGTTRMITLAGSDRTETASVEQAKPVGQAKPVEQALVARPAVVNSADTKPADATDQKARRNVRRESDRDWTERRIRRELARYGIY